MLHSTIQRLSPASKLGLGAGLTVIAALTWQLKNIEDNISTTLSQLDADSTAVVLSQEECLETTRSDGRNMTANDCYESSDAARIIKINLSTPFNQFFGETPVGWQVSLENPEYAAPVYAIKPYTVANKDIVVRIDGKKFQLGLNHQ